MMLPARALWPPNSLTPRRFDSESRPLRDEPPAFLCAMVGYFAFGAFLAAPLAGAASFVDPVSALAAFLGFAAGSGAGFSVGTAVTSAGAVSAFGAFAA